MSDPLMVFLWAILILNYALLWKYGPYTGIAVTDVGILILLGYVFYIEAISGNWSFALWFLAYIVFYLISVDMQMKEVRWGGRTYKFVKTRKGYEPISYFPEANRST